MYRKQAAHQLEFSDRKRSINSPVKIYIPIEGPGKEIGFCFLVLDDVSVWTRE